MLPPKSVIFDTDPGIDDAMALWLLARHPAVQLRAITTVFGNAPLASTSRNALRLAALMGLRLPVAAGAAAPLRLAAEQGFPAHVHGDDGLGGMALHLPPPAQSLDPRPAYQLICDAVNEAPGEISLVAVGPLTNLALALRHDPGIAAKVAQVVVMGGAFGVKGHSGNVTPVAEANIVNDPEAADLVFTADWPVTLIGLDITQEVVMREADLAFMRGKGGERGRVGDFLWQATRHYQDFYHERDGIGGIYAHDASAAAFCIDPSLFTLRAGPVRVVTDGIARGQTIQEHRQFGPGPSPWSACPSQQVGVGVDAAGVRALFALAFEPQ